MKNIKRTLILGFLATILINANAERYVGDKATKTQNQTKAATCLPASNSNELDINNVRVFIETGGTMWFKETAQYEVPKGSGKTSMFAAALWIGGLDVNEQLKIAAVRFRQVGDDFWPGPLTVDGAAYVDQATCSEYDKHFKITRADVEYHIANWDQPNYEMPTVIRDWPAHGDVTKKQTRYLAPFKDVDGDGEYNPANGDYPYYDFDNELCPWTLENMNNPPQFTMETNAGITGYFNKDPNSGFGKGLMADHVLKGDQTLYWIFNDKGGPHTETQGDAIGLEIRGQAFAFATNTEINNMTFYSYEIINRSTYTLTETYFSQWVDPDLGYEKDDYVGCDVNRGLGYCYNGAEIDGQGLTHHYGTQPPAVGVDFFQGPYMDPDNRDNPKFNRDSSVYTDYCNKFIKNSEYPLDQMAINGVNFGDGIVDNERFGMRRFVYHNNDNSNNGDPSIHYQYYYMLKGIWKDGQKMKYGGNAYNTATGPECDFMFPGDTDPCNWGTSGQITGQDMSKGGWIEKNVPNQPGDRRFMQSAGPFTLMPGAVNYITVGIPWARATSGGAYASVTLLKAVDDKAQNLFENCFKVLDGPDAPELVAQEMDKEIILYLVNEENSNNYNEKYGNNEDPNALDNTIPTGREDVSYDYTSVTDSTYKIDTTTTQINYDRYYHFEGYLVYQLKDADVSVSDITDPDKAQLVFQCDVKNYDAEGNPIAQLINYEMDDNLGTEVPVEKVNGANEGITHSIRITEDQFAIGNKTLVNHKKYYFVALAYAYNQYEKYSTDPSYLNGLIGQKTTYLAGRKMASGSSITPITVIPHIPSVENNGTIVNSEYGTQPQITRVEGQGNGGFFLELTQATINKILSTYPNPDVNNPSTNINQPYTNFYNELTYENNAGPLNVKVIDPLAVKSREYTLKFVESADDVTDSTTWILTADGMDTIFSDKSISLGNEQLILNEGLSIQLINEQFAVYDATHSTYDTKDYYHYNRWGSVELINATREYTDESQPWMSFLSDVDGTSAMNWIRSGQTQLGEWGFGEEPVATTYTKLKQEDYATISAPNTAIGQSNDYRVWKDPNSQFENILSGTWAPYRLTSCFDEGPMQRLTVPDVLSSSSETATETIEAFANYKKYRTVSFNETMTNIYSVDIVFTSNTDLWTRCVVLEAGSDRDQTQGKALRHEPRKALSVGKDGKPDGSKDGYGTNSNQGMGWFPGYAINVETGERLNVMFSEDSSLPEENGSDMIFNPSPNYFSTIGKILMGGKHYVYVVGSVNTTNASVGSVRETKLTRDCPAYDGCQWIKSKFNVFLDKSETSRTVADYNRKNEIFNNVMWVSVPISNENYTWLMPNNDCKVKIRVTRPYMRYCSRWGEGVPSPKNNDMPLYKFSTSDIAVQTNVLDTAKSVLDLISVVPNPYYGYSTYETTQLENKVKIVNLPKECTISIYTVNGTLVRRLTKDDEVYTHVEWDLKNSAYIPISSGVYIIHVEAPGIGEKTIKWFGAMRQTDLNAF